MRRRNNNTTMKQNLDIVNEKIAVNRKARKIIIPLLIILVLILLTFLGYKFYIKKLEKNILQNSKECFSSLKLSKDFGQETEIHKYTYLNSYSVKYPKTDNTKLDESIQKTLNDIKYDFERNNSLEGLEILKSLPNYQILDYSIYLAPENTISLVIFEYIGKYKQTEAIKNIYTYVMSLENGDVLKDTYFFLNGYKEKISKIANEYILKNKLNDIHIDPASFKNIALTNEGILLYIKDNKNNIKNISINYDKLKEIMDIDTSKKTLNPIIIDSTKNTSTTYSPINKNLYSTKSTNVYDKDNKNSLKIGELNKGQYINVIANSNFGWSKIKFNSKEGFVKSAMLSQTPIAISNFKQVDETVYITMHSNIKESNSNESKTIGTLDYPNSVKRIGIGTDGFSEILFNNAPAFIYTSCLSTRQIKKERKIDPTKPMVAITFDDGPNPVSTNRILDTLQKYNQVATFFDVGKLIYQYPNVVKREEKIGCEVGSHTYSHSNLIKLTNEQISSEISKASQAIKSVLGHYPNLFRPPYGNYNNSVKTYSNCPIILWDIDTLDWKSKNKQSILDMIHKYSNLDGRIILMHSIYPTTADAVEELVPELISKGYQLVTISEMARYKNIPLRNQATYYNFK